MRSATQALKDEVFGWKHEDGNDVAQDFMEEEMDELFQERPLDPETSDVALLAALEEDVVVTVADDREDDDQGEEQHPVAVPSSPTAPSVAEIEEHEASGHVVHRSWCPPCVRARGVFNPHRAAPEDAERDIADHLL